jgi:hypothetical protein
MVAEPADLVVDHLRILSLGPDALAFNAFLEKIGGSLEHLELPGGIGEGRNRYIRYHLIHPLCAVCVLRYSYCRCSAFDSQMHRSDNAQLQRAQRLRPSARHHLYALAGGLSAPHHCLDPHPLAPQRRI